VSQYFQRRRPARSGVIPDVIFIILILNGVLFAAQNLIDGPRSATGPISTYLALWPLEGFREFYPWQLVSYGFLHGDVMHILFNMVMLWMFGRELEGLMGPKRFLTYYLTCVIGAGLVQMVVAGLQGGQYPTIGASGGVFGILLAFGMAFPNRMILLLIPPIPMKAKYLVVLAGLMELYFGVSGTRPGIASFAHLGGMLFGVLLILYWKRKARR
jgi:membrane associated rhomboid family serine protease